MNIFHLLSYIFQFSRIKIEIPTIFKSKISLFKGCGNEKQSSNSTRKLIFNKIFSKEICSLRMSYERYFFTNKRKIPLKPNFPFYVFCIFSIRHFWLIHFMGVLQSNVQISIPPLWFIFFKWIRYLLCSEIF